MRGSFAVTALATLLPSIAAAQGQLRIADLGSCRLESGSAIENCRVGYRTFGSLDSTRTNAVLVPTWFTGTSEELAGLVWPDGPLDPTDQGPAGRDRVGRR